MEFDLFVFLEPSIALLIGILTYLVTKNSNKHCVALDRLKCAYHPLFLAIEPYLYKSVNKKFALVFVEKFNRLNDNYSVYIYPSLRFRVEHLHSYMRAEYSQDSIDEHWMLICKYIEKDYDKLCRLSHMPIRSTAYRLNLNQFSSKLSLYWGMFKLFFFPPVLNFLIWSGLLLLVVVIKLLSS